MPARQHVKGRYCLDQDAGLAINDAGHQRAEAHLFRQSHQVAERAVAFEHRFFSTADPLYLEEMVHDPDAGKAGIIGSAGNLGGSAGNLGQP